MTDEELESIDVLVTYNSFEKLDISKMKNLKYIQLGSTGFDQVPKDKIINRDILLCNNKGGYSIPIAEWIVSTILQIYKNTKAFYVKQLKKIKKLKKKRRATFFDNYVSKLIEEGKRLGITSDEVIEMIKRGLSNE